MPMMDATARRGARHLRRSVPTSGPQPHPRAELTPEASGRLSEAGPQQTPGSIFCRFERTCAERRFCGPAFLMPGRGIRHVGSAHPVAAQVSASRRQSAAQAVSSAAVVDSRSARVVNAVARAGSVAS